MLEPNLNKKIQEQINSPIPDKRYFAIGEVARLCNLKTHVLRYWEQEFRQLRPSKRRGNRRYYQRKDVILIRQIKNLLYEQGYTILGAKAQLNGINQEKQPILQTQINVNQSEKIQSIAKELENIVEILEN